jgi:integrase
MLLILTGQRRGEIAALKRAWVDHEKITLPAVLTKNGREHVLPIGARAQRVIRLAGSGPGLLFPARGLPNTPFSGWSKSKKALDRISGVKDWTLHDLRRTFSSGLAALGTPLHVTEKLLNHVSGSISGVAAIYNRHTYMDEMRSAITAWETRLESLLATESTLNRPSAT